MEIKEFNFGLNPLPLDARDFSLGAIYDLPKLSELPPTFEHEPLFIGNQLRSYFCTAFATCGASSLQEGIALVPEYTYAIEGQINGAVNMIGYDLRTAMQAHRKIGAIAEQDRPQGFKLLEKDEAFLADIKNWPDLSDQALEHSKESFLSVTGGGDFFDSIRLTIWKFRSEKRAVVFGLEWSWPMDNPIINTISGSGGGHAVYATGWKSINGKPYLTIVNSYGNGVGDNGKFYLSREIVNKFVEIYGAYMFHDLTTAEYEDLLKQKQQAKNGIIDFIKNFILYLQNLLTVKKNNEMTKTSKIEIWAKAIQAQEGGKPNDRNMRNNNPGNIKSSMYTLTLGSEINIHLGKAIATDKDGFLVFDSYESGFKALCQFLTDACNNRLKPYHDKNLKEFTKIYANPPDDNYAKNVARVLGVEVTIPIKFLL